MAEAIIFIGLQGSGKTTYYSDCFSKTHAHVSRDVQKTAKEEAGVLRECLRSGRSFVLDDTNPTRAARAHYIEEAHAAGFRVLAYFFNVPVPKAIGRNNHRKDKKSIPVPAILRTAKRLEPPSRDEGFDEIHTVELKDRARDQPH